MGHGDRRNPRHDLRRLRIEAAITHLETAHRLLRENGHRHAPHVIQGAINSTKSTLRHELRTQSEERTKREGSQ
jgi:hypothetical protein